MNSSSENLNSLFKEIYLTTVTFVFTFFTLSAYSPCFTLSCVRLGPEPDPTATPPAACRADATCFVAHVPRSLSVLKKKKKPLLCAMILFPCTKLLSTWTGKSGGTNNWSRGRLNKWWSTKENDCGHSHTAMHMSMPHLIA